jgi:2-oxoacid:acceptor oxidoreductase delta subunit (pyruvate/2-ketoisovalerate family)
MKDKPFAITLDVGSSLANKTGSWRTERPVYVDLLPPCSNACPAGENVQQWLYHAEEGRYEDAWRQIVADNPFPAIMGRVCYRPCETACNRAQLDHAVGINSVERFLGDEAIRRNWTVRVTAPPSGKRVLVVGAGPSGLAAAYHLALLGHNVTIRDAGAAPGGMMRYGIPKYRLPRDILDAEIARVAGLGVTIECGQPVTDILGAMREEGFDAVFLAVGAHIGRRTYIPAGDTARILDAVTLLRGMEDEQPPMLGRRVIVYGGGNTAMDTARTAKRLGATDAIVVYRRTRDRMPAHDIEVAEALEEGITIKWLSTIARAEGDHITVEKMRLDDTGFPQPTGEFEELDADCVVLALGQQADLSLLAGVPGVEETNGVVKVGPDLMTGHPGIFAGGDMAGSAGGDMAASAGGDMAGSAGGDMIPAERTVTTAVGHGRRAARHIDAWLRGTEYRPPARPALAAYDQLNPWYFADAPATMRPVLDAARRTSTFDEVVGGLGESTALFEARRCMSCGNCFECDNCFGVCPDNAVIKLGPGQRYTIDLDYCKGCGICVTECPAGAIQMIPETT